MEIVLIVASVSCIVFGGFGSWIATQKNRSAFEGFCVGALFGPIGCIVVAVLPTIPSKNRGFKRHRSGRWDYHEPAPPNPQEEQVADWVMGQAYPEPPDDPSLRLGRPPKKPR